MRPVLPLFLLVASVGLVAGLARPPPKPLRNEGGLPVLPRPEALLALFKSHRHLVTDLYWLGTTYRAGIARTENEYRDVAAYVQLVTDLDPKFRLAYPFGAVIVPFNRGREQWMNTADSTAIAEKGLKQFPHDLDLSIILAYNLSYFHHDYHRAADILVDVARIPGAPGYLPALATRLYAMSDSFDAALSLAELIQSQAPDEKTREFFEQRAGEIRLEKLLRSVESAAVGFKRERGRPPFTVDELYSAGFLETLPIDPLGGRITLDARGKASSSESVTRLRTFLPPGSPTNNE